MLDFLTKQKKRNSVGFLCVKINNCVGEFNLNANSWAETNQKVNFPKVLISMQIIQFEVSTFNIKKRQQRPQQHHRHINNREIN